MVAITLSTLDFEGFNKEIRTDPLGMMLRLREEGRVCAIPIEGEQRLIVAAEPAVAAAALAHGSRNHRELLRELVGSGLFVVASGEQWRHRRGLLRPMFASRAVAELHGLVLAATEDFVQRELLPKAGVEFDLAEALQRLSIELILRLVDPELAGSELHRLTDALHTAVDHLDRKLFDPERVQDGDDEAFAADKRILEEFIDRRAAEQTCPVTGAGVLAGLVAALREDGGDEDPGQVLREEMLSVFVAGVETMGTLLTWIFYNLDGSAEALGHCVDEVRAEDLGALGGAASMPSGALAYTRAVVEESLRLHPPAWALFRRIDETLDVAGVRLNQGDFVLAGTYAIQRDPALWDAPEEFRPERFLDGRPPVQQYFPFGAGPHQCLGRQFSLLEAQLATATILRHGRLVLTGDRATTGLRPAIALSPDPHPRAVFVPHGSVAATDAAPAAYLPASAAPGGAR